MKTLTWLQKGMAIGIGASLLPWAASSGLDSANLTPPVPQVRVRLLSAISLESVVISSFAPMLINGQMIKGPVQIIKSDDQLRIISKKKKWKSAPSFTIEALNNGTLSILAPHKEVTTGRLQIIMRRRIMEVLNTLPIDDYALGVLAPEMESLDFPMEALNAQLVASRSYALAMMGRHHHEGYDFCDTPHCQVYGGKPVLKVKLYKALKATAGEYLTYHHRPILAFFHDSCGGTTASAHEVWKMQALPYLRTRLDGQPDAYCRKAPRARWTIQMDRHQLQTMAISNGWIRGGESIKKIGVISRDHSGRVHAIQIQGRGSRTISGDAFRQACNTFFGHEVIYSTLYRLELSKKGLRIDGRGWGHGIGLCQWGAIGRARAGQTYRQILAHYYPGTRLASFNPDQNSKKFGWIPKPYSVIYQTLLHTFYPQPALMN